MILKVLGSAAGGGFPQWNCTCPTCAAVRRDNGTALARTQSSLALRSNDGPWFLVNASPDVRAQLELLREGRTTSLRESPIAGVVLTDAEIDHTAGLLILRESAAPLSVYGTEPVRRALTEGHPLTRVLDEYCGVEWHPIEPGVEEAFTLEDNAELEVEAFPVPSDPPRYVGGWGGDEPWAVGLTFRDTRTGGVATYAPALAEMEEAVTMRFEESDLVLVDGTFWTDDELPSLGIGDRTARDMSHLPLSGPRGSLERLASLERPRVVLVHINNTNPILLEDSPERRAVEATGVEVARDGLTVEL